MLSLVFLVYLILSLWSRLNLLLPSYVVFLIRASHFILVLMFVSILGIPLSLAFSKTPYQYDALHYISRSFYRILSYLIGVYVHIDGFELKNFHSQAIYVVNHQASLDGFLVGALFPKRTSVLAKKALGNAPIFGQFLRLAHAIFVDRENHESAMKTMRESSEKIIKEKLSLLVFPEGTRSHKKDRTLLPFKKGAFHLAVQTQLPIIPIVISNYDDIYDSQKKLFHNGTVHIRVLDPISTTGISKNDIELLIEKTRNCMMYTLKQISPPIKNTS